MSYRSHIATLQVFDLDYAVRLLALEEPRGKGTLRPHLLGASSKERTMWKVSDVEPVRVLGAEVYPYGFNVTTEDGKPVVSFAYASRALAEAGATHLESALLNAISVHPYAE